MVFGVATCVESVHSLLNHASSNLLTLQTFQLESSSLFLGNIIEKVGAHTREKERDGERGMERDLAMATSIDKPRLNNYLFLLIVDIWT